MPANPLTMIELSNISKTYGSGVQARAALSGINIEISAGESVAVVGESGAGKSTLSWILLRLTAPSTGTYRWEGTDVWTLRGRALRDWRRQVQAVFQNPLSSLNPRVRVETLITEPLEATIAFSRRTRRRQAIELLELVGLPEVVGSRYPHQLSGGQRQRVSIARAISTRPRMLVLDEPLSALDVSVRAQVLNLLLSLRHTLNVTFVYVTHDLATVRALCDRAYVLYRGAIFESLPTADLVTGPDNPYSAELLASVPSISKKAMFQDTGRMARSISESGGCRFESRCKYAKAICAASEPSLKPVSPMWNSRCHFAGEVKVNTTRVVGGVE
jgi:oligopeptide transport system ATP-binding protein